MTHTIKNQFFGVEVEFTGITREKASEVVAEHFNSSVAYEGGVYRTRTIRDNQNRNWKIVRDSSIVPSGYNDETRCELVTPKLTYNDIEDLQEIVRKLRKAGGKVNSSCGIHIHINAEPHNEWSIKNLVFYMREKEDLLFKSLNVSEERASRWCKKIDKDFLDDLKKKAVKESGINGLEEAWYKKNPQKNAHYNNSRYHALNLHNLWYRGTIEFRLFNSTLHAGEIRSYICLCLALSARALKYSDKIDYVRKYTGSKEKSHWNNHLKTLGLSGAEFRNVRTHLCKHLTDEE